jgi:2,3-bisphosphoglycerate-independent phosphoglycerate mutase
MHFLFLFLDGVGLGPDEPDINPFALAHMPNLMGLLGGCRLVRDTLGDLAKPAITDQATLLGLDATLGVDGPPQSASGQAAILTGVNIPAVLGGHYGPKPNPEIRSCLRNGNLFHRLKERGYRTALLNAYPQSYFDAIDSGRRLPGAVAMAALEAGIRLKTTSDLFEGRAISADFTGRGWRERLRIPDTPVLTLSQAGERLARLSRSYDFTFFEYWISDYAGHRSDMDQSVQVLQNFDAVLGGLISAWDPNRDVILITSDHGNLEDNLTRKHTRNLVPGLIIGPQNQRERLRQSLTDLTDITPAILKLFE